MRTGLFTNAAGTKSQEHLQVAADQSIRGVHRCQLDQADCRDGAHQPQTFCCLDCTKFFSCVEI